MFKKKSQITIFIVLGVIIVSVFAMVFYSNYNKQNTQNDILKTYHFEEDINSVNSFIDSCHNIVATQGAYYIASKNGYYVLPGEYTQEGKYTFTYVYRNSTQDTNISLSLNQIEENYARYIRDRLPICVDRFEEFKKMGMKIDEGRVTSKVDILDDKIIINTVYDVKIDFKDSHNEIYELSPIEVPVRLGLMYGASQKILQWIQDEPSLISTKDISDLMEDLNMNATIDAFDDTSIYIITDVQSSILSGVVVTNPSTNNELFEYVFGAKFE